MRGNDVSGHCKEASAVAVFCLVVYEVSCRVGARGSNVPQNNKKKKKEEEMYVVRVKSSQVVKQASAARCRAEGAGGQWRSSVSISILCSLYIEGLFLF